MDMRGQQHISATREVVWNALNDPDVLRVCIPGCQELIKSSDTEMTAVAVMKVGPVTARFQGAVTLSDLDPPNGYKISGEGQGGVAGFAKGTAIVKLEAVDDGTILHYEVDAQIGGKLSQLGGRLIDATAKKMSGLFFSKFAEEIKARQQPQQLNVKTAQPHEAAAGAPSGAFAPVARQRSERTSGPAASVPAGSHKQAGALSVAMLIVAIGSLLLFGWFYYKGMFPSLAVAPDANGRTHVSPDFASAVQLIMVAAIGYLFGARSRNRG